jgi:nucleotide-binding universal stress UspA family protein
MIGGRGDGMAEVRDRDRTAAPVATARTGARPVVLATLQVRIDPAAEDMAVASALEAGVPLIVANMLHLPPYPATVMLVGAQNATLPHEEALEEVRATAARAAALGIPTELLRVSSRRPVRALLQLVAERDAGLLVFGPSSGRIRGPRLRAAERRVRRDAPCLVWVAPDG